jgi:hypothetical protein
VYLVKTDSAGIEQWSRAFGDELIEEAFAVRAMADGGFIVLAQAMRPAADYIARNPDRFMIRTDAWGNETWSCVWQEDGVQGATLMLPAPDDHWLIAGLVSAAGTEGTTDPWLMLVNSQGEVIWDRPVGDEGCFDYASGVVETADGGYVLTGMAECGGRSSVLLIKVDQDGILRWQQNLAEGKGPRVGLRVFEAADGGLVVVGQADAHMAVALRPF